MLSIFLLLALVIVLYYFYLKRNFQYWKVRNVKHEDPVLFFGTYTSVYFAKQSRSQKIEELYLKYPDEKVVGSFKSTVPELIIKDPEIIKRVLTSDFSSFTYRGMSHKEYIEPLRKNLFFLEGDIWKMVRQRTTPAFTSGKLKAMFPLIVERAEKLLSRTLASAKVNSSMDARDLMARYTTDFIGACGFGIDTDSLNEENSAFRKLGIKTFSFNFKDVIGIMLQDVFPEIGKYFAAFGKVESDVFELVEDIKKQRNYKPSNRNDFVDLMLGYWNKPMEVESLEKVNPDGTPMKVSAILDDEIFAAQIFVFFAAGFETSASSTSYALHQLAFNPEVQKKVQENIDKVLAKHNNKLSYDAVKEMTYLEWAYKEGLRMFPSLGYITRKCSTKKYTFQDLNLTIDQDVIVSIPIQGLHMDPKYWDEPETFRPERFHPDNFNATQKMIYLPFGDGPRNCIGSRLGLMQSMAGLAAILSKFTVEPAPTTLKRPVLNPRSIAVQGITGGLPLLFKERNT